MPVRNVFPRIPPQGADKVPARDNAVRGADAADPFQVHCVQLTSASELRLKASSPLPDQTLIDNENTQENRLRKGQEKATADMEERARALLEEELKALSYFEKGEIAVYRIYVCREARRDVARALYLNPETSALKVTMSRALATHRCGKNPKKCDGVPDCAHSRGKSLWETITERVRLKLAAQ